MRYFSDEKLRMMREQIKKEYNIRDSAEYLAYITRIEMLDKQNDKYGNCKAELMQAISEMSKRTEQYVHRGISDPNDDDADAFEYENYDFKPFD